jgi:hypothetical protein
MAQATTLRALVLVAFGAALLPASAQAQKRPRPDRSLNEALPAEPEGPREITLDNVLNTPMPPQAARLLQQMPVNVELVRLWAKVIRTDGSQVVASGEVRLVSGNTELLASEIRLDPATGRAMAVGRAVLRDRGTVVVCDGLVVDLDQSGAEAGPVVVSLYGKGADAAAAAHLAAHGEGTLVEGRQFVASGDWLGGRLDKADEKNSVLTVVDAWATPCACSEELPPTWSVRVGRIVVKPGAHAILESPVFELFGVPVAWLPMALIPLGDRRTGLLPPTIQFRDGVWINQPVFVTLGRSLDATLSPGLVLQAVENEGVPLPWVGPRAEGELRWAPARGHRGEFALVYQLDENFSRRGDAGGVGHRAGGRLQHRGHLGKRGRIHADLRLGSDRRVPADLGADLGTRVQPYLRSAGQVSQSFRRFGVGVGGALFQDLKQESLFLANQEMAVRAQDLGHAEGRFVPWPLFGLPVLLSGAATIDNALALGFEEDRPLERDVGQRAALQAGADAGFGSRWGSGMVFSRWRQAHLLDGQAGGAHHQFSALFGAQLQTRAEGPLVGSKGRVIHALRPRIWAAAMPWVGGEGIEFDQADRWRPGQEVAVGIDQTLTRREAILPFLDAKAALSTDPLEPGDPTYLLDHQLQRRGTRIQLMATGSLLAPSLDGFRAALSLPLTSRLRARTGYWRLSEERPRFLYAQPEEPLAGWSILQPGDAVLRDALEGGLSWRVGAGFTLRYEGTVGMGDFSGAPRLLTHGGKATWVAPCDCMTLSTQVRFWPNRPLPDFRFTLALSALGESVRLF